MIKSQDITLVFQGAIGLRGSPERVALREGLNSAQRFFPEAEVILSTWKGSLDEDFPQAKVVECEDPGPIQCAAGEIINLNRQLVSSREGVKASTRPWVVKLRTDMYFEHGRLFDWFCLIDGPGTPISAQRILVLNLTGRNPRGPQPYPFNVCDWLYAGTRQDLIALFSVSNYPAEWAFWFSPETKPNNDPYEGTLCRFYAETYIWWAFVSRTVELDLEHSSDSRPHLVAFSEEIIAKNLIVLRACQAGVGSMKHKLPFDYHYVNYSYCDWLNLLRRHNVGHRLPRPLLDLEKAHAYWLYTLRPFFQRFKRVHLQGNLKRIQRVIARCVDWLFK